MIGALPAPDRLPVLVGAIAVLAAAIVVAKSTGWTRTRRPLARAMLYAGFALVLGAGAWWGTSALEESRQEALITRIYGAERIRSVDPEGAARVLTEDVLAADPGDDVRRRAHLALAATYDELARYAEAESTYALADREWRAGLARGPLVLPWASMRLRAGKPDDALVLLTSAGAAEGFGTAEESASVHAELCALARERIERPVPAVRRVPAARVADPGVR